MSKQRSSRQRSVIVVGAGPGGLASAMLLAAAGFDVTVLERHQRVGGRTATIEKDGFRFDLGPTFFLYPEVLRRIFAMCGRRLDDEVELMRLDPQYHLRYEDGAEIHATPDPEAMAREVARLSPHDAGNLERFMADNRRKLEAFRPVLESPFARWRDLLPLLPSLPLVRPWASVDADLRRYFRDPRVRLAFSFQSKYLGMSPYQCPSLFTILSFIEYESGVFHPRGGCGAVTRAMARVAESLGARISLGEPVERILFDGRRAVGVRTARRVLPCDALVVNADFAHAMKQLVPDRLRRRWSDRKLAKKRYSCSTFMLYLGIEGRYDDLAHHTIFLADGYRENLRDITHDHRLSANPSFYVQNPCVTDPDMAPPGHSTLYVLVPVPHQHRNVDWRAAAPAMRRRALDQLAKLGLDDLEGRIRSERMVTPDNWAGDMALYRGATFSLAHSLDQMLHLRPNNRFEELDGVYLTGGGTHPGSGLPVIFESARIASRLMAEDFGVGDAWPSIEVGDEQPGAGTVPRREVA